MRMFNPPHPGRIIMNQLIRDEEENDIESVSDVADTLGCHRSTLNRIIKGDANITTNMALALEIAGYGSAEHWLTMQSSYDLFQLRYK